MSDLSSQKAAKAERHTAGAFDIRNVIGALLFVYGVILLVTRFVEGDRGGEQSDAVNANLWAGIGLVVVGVVFATWARLRPVVVPEHLTTPEEMGGPGA